MQLGAIDDGLYASVEIGSFLNDLFPPEKGVGRDFPGTYTGFYQRPLTNPWDMGLDAVGLHLEAVVYSSKPWNADRSHSWKRISKIGSAFAWVNNVSQAGYTRPWISF